MRTLQVLSFATTLAALAGLPAGAQQTPAEDGTSANGPITILKNMQMEPDGVRVTIDGRGVDHLQTVAYDDITTSVHAGRNTLTVTWNTPVQRFNFKVAYAPTRNNFRSVLIVQNDASRDPALRQSGSRTFTFTIPG
jgi:hypothetical protein